MSELPQSDKSVRLSEETVEVMRGVLRDYWKSAGHTPEAPDALCDLALEALARPSVAQPFSAETLSRAEDTLRAQEQEFSVKPITFLTIDFWRARAVYLSEQIVRSAPSHARQPEENRSVDGRADE